ncbi:PREDICTED: uncharacterized protein LOC109581010 isoform X2 [Amphimedon queenslandica]|uniref:Uncharacterized protein n=1 Tax=Amphimedon queenslandica TaxID=400682 RepID=A0AAN0J0M3_AMPQE|nr:PREDICTED: uncharacterized protein LOC109581010 isoform X2 [Amphimedon queenslandica]|eukprot:XP_019850278.1 PREDICTED: uncharacterized protein LOC109581010 isoform X2 [Amphimedon queenslandica]
MKIENSVVGSGRGFNLCYTARPVGFMEDRWDDVVFLLRRINDFNSQIAPYNKKAISYLLRKQKDVNLAQVFNVAKEKYGCDTNQERFSFVVMVMKLSGCITQAKELVKGIDPSLVKRDGFELLNKCLANDDDHDRKEALISMRAILIALDIKLRESGLVETFLENIEDSATIEPNKLKTIRSVLSMDPQLQTALGDFEASLEKLKPKVILQEEILATIPPSDPKERFSHSVGNEEAHPPGPPPAYSPHDELCVGTTSSSATSSVTDTRSRATSDTSSFRHLRAPHLSNTQRQMTYPPIANESPPLPFPTTAQANSIEPNDATGTQTELSNTGNSVPGDN